MSLTISAIGQAIKEALRDSAAILAACNDRFGKAHTVFYGASGQESPGSDEFPAFTIVPWGKAKGEEEERRLFNFSIFLELADTMVTESESSGVVCQDYRGPESLETLLELALTEILGISEELGTDELSFAFNPIEYFPVMVGELTMTLSFPSLIGGFEPTI
jgi:hypothetical protein